MSVKRYQVSGYEWELEEAGTRADVPVDEWPEVLVAATDFDAIASRLEEAAGRWVEWKSGDALPADGLYWVQYPDKWPYPQHGATHSSNFREPLIAYWSAPLPPPYEARP